MSKFFTLRNEEDIRRKEPQWMLFVSELKDTTCRSRNHTRNVKAEHVEGKNTLAY